VIVDDAVEIPFGFTDLTEIVYVLLAPKPKIVIGEVRLDPVKPLKSVAIYPLTMLPTGGVKLIVILVPVTPTNDKLVGGPGYILVVIEFDTDDATEIPLTLVAVIVNIYAVFIVRPLILIGDDVPVAVILLGLLVTV
jgi:hypothetical protein